MSGRMPNFCSASMLVRGDDADADESLESRLQRVHLDDGGNRHRFTYELTSAADVGLPPPLADDWWGVRNEALVDTIDSFPLPKHVYACLSEQRRGLELLKERGDLMVSLCAIYTEMCLATQALHTIFEHSTRPISPQLLMEYHAETFQSCFSPCLRV